MPATTTVPAAPRRMDAGADIRDVAALPAGAPKTPLKKKLMKPVLGLVVLLLVAFVMKGKFIKAHYGPHSKVPNGQIIELQSESGTNTITTNLSDGHLAQVGVSLQLTAAASMKEVTKLEDELMGSTITIVGAQSYSSLLAPGARAALASQLLGTYQRELGLSAGAEQVSAVYFTSFVLQ